ALQRGTRSMDQPCLTVAVWSFHKPKFPDSSHFPIHSFRPSSPFVSTATSSESTGRRRPPLPPPLPPATLTSSANMDSEPSSQNPTDMTAFVQNLLGQMVSAFEYVFVNIYT
uniref:Uncharacterized protein n=1 Tax=Aegilops tauschii subsp. strangulata TaxID=200361 RepID=A0A453KQE7_AEGTS